MILKKAHIKNFRSIADQVIDFGMQTSFLGANGAGKSTILRALDKFYAASPNIESDDFHGRKYDQPIEIELTFTNFNAVEQEAFKGRIENNELTVARIFENGSSKGAFYGYSRQHPKFVEIRAIQGATPQRKAFNELDRTGEFSALPTATNAAGMTEAMDGWEAANLDKCALQRDDGKFFGFHNVGQGRLSVGTTFVFVPAVKDAAADAIDSKSTAIGRLMELLVKSAIQKKAEVTAFNNTMAEKYKALTSPESMPELGELGNKLTETLKNLYANADVELLWREPENFQMPLPLADVLLGDDGFKGPVDRKGHGLQRAFILALLQHLAVASSLSNGAEEAAVNPERQTSLPGLILAIEEPELYQHPTKQRHFADILSRLSNGKLQGVASTTQVILASHSSLFVSMEKYDEVRITRREPCEGEAFKQCKIQRADTRKIVSELEKVHGAKQGSWTPESLKSRLHTFDSETAEGFFSSAVVLVEGVSDRAALLTAAASMGIYFAAKDISILPVSGKANLDRTALIFRDLGIPTFVIWDCDSNCEKDDLEKNKTANAALLRLNGVTPQDDILFKSEIAFSYARFEDKLETTLIAEIGKDVIEKFVAPLKEAYWIKGTSALMKNPMALKELLELIYKDGKQSQTLNKIVEAIAALVKESEPEGETPAAAKAAA